MDQLTAALLRLLEELGQTSFEFSVESLRQATYAGQLEEIQKIIDRQDWEAEKKIETIRRLLEKETEDFF